MRNFKPIVIIPLLIAVLLSGCGSNPTPVETTNNPVTAPTNQPVSPGSPTSYPAPFLMITNTPFSVYPAPNSSNPPVSAYPGPATGTPAKPGKVDVVPFKLDKPVMAGSKDVTGTGPAGIPILLVDITMNGNVLAQTSIQPDGKFHFTLGKPLQKDDWIGIALTDLKGTEWTSQDFNSEGFNGGSPNLVPNVGFFFDTAMVSAQ